MYAPDTLWDHTKDIWQRKELQGTLHTLVYMCRAYVCAYVCAYVHACVCACVHACVYMTICVSYSHSPTIDANIHKGLVLGSFASF